jgi:type VI protein secretion system component Hcp
MSDSKFDLLMKFVLNGKPVFGECTLAIDKTDALIKDDFLPARQGTDATFFEVTDFDMGLSLKESDDGAINSASGPFARWRSATKDEYKKIFYPMEFDKFSFDRIIDKASPVFFQSCCNSVTFDSAAMARRVSQGNLISSSRPPVAYLRIDFTKVLITGLNWTDGDVVKESCEFICQGMTMTYIRQAEDGSVAAGAGNQSKAYWPNPKNDRGKGILTGKKSS